MKKYKPLSLKRVRRYSLKQRKSKVSSSQVAGIYRRGGSFEEFLASMPNVLAGKDIVQVASAIIEARTDDRPVVLAMGAHPIKVGLSGTIIDLINSGIITAIATNGAAIVHDFELSYAGMTSEEVAEELSEGTFGMAQETGRLVNRAVNAGVENGYGIGRAVGEFIHAQKGFHHRHLSIFNAAYVNSIPSTVHVAVGTDIIHMHPEADGASIGEGSMRDFKLFSSVVADLEGGVFINLGSAVIIPEVFLKALTIARNLGYEVNNFTTVTMDFIRQYRAMENVLQRPTLRGGKAYFLTGHHEINLPLLVAIVKEKARRESFSKGGRY